MRKSLFTLLTTVLLLSSVSAMANLSQDMAVLNSGLQTVNSTDDIGQLKKVLTDMRGAAENAKTQTPYKLTGQPSDSPQMKEYQAGLDTLIGQIDSSIKLADAGDLAGAKAQAKKFAAIRDENHKKFF